MPPTFNGPGYRRVSSDYLAGGDPLPDLQDPYEISNLLCITGRDSFGCDRLSAQRELFGRRVRPPTLFEELNAAAMPSRPLAEYYGSSEAGLFSLWLDHLLIGKGTPAMGTQDGIRYVVDYGAEGGNGGFFRAYKARKDLILTNWEAHVIGSLWVILPGRISELPCPLDARAFRYSPQDVDLETGFIGKSKKGLTAFGEQMDRTFPAWISAGPQRLEGLRPVTIEPGGDVNAVWNLDDRKTYLAARMVKRA
jgi:hypothetical protein